MEQTNTSIILCVYQGNYGLPSIDVTSLQILLYLRLHPEHTVKIQTAESLTTPEVPSIIYEGETITDRKRIFDILKRKVGKSCNAAFTKRQKVEIADNISLNYSLMDSPFMLYCWGITKNAKYLRKVYSREKFPGLQEPYSKRMSKYTKKRVKKILCKRPIDLCAKFGRTIVIRYLDYLEGLLAKKKFMFGDKPSSFDAHLVGYLGPLLRLKFPKPELQIVLRKKKNLCKYTNNFLKLYGDKYVKYPLPGEEVIKKEDWLLKSFIMSSLIIFVIFLIPYLCYALFD